MEKTEMVYHIWQNYFDDEQNLVEMELTFLLLMKMESMINTKKDIYKGLTQKRNLRYA